MHILNSTLKREFPFIVVEGTEGSGKTTFAKQLVDHINARSCKPYGNWTYLHFPNNECPREHRLENIIDRLDLDPNNKFDIQTAIGVHMVYYMKNCLPGPVVIDRWFYSNIVYSIFENTDLLSILKWSTAGNLINRITKEEFNTLYIYDILDYYGYNCMPNVTFLLNPTDAMVRHTLSTRKKDTTSIMDKYDNDIEGALKIKEIFSKLFSKNAYNEKCEAVDDRGTMIKFTYNDSYTSITTYNATDEGDMPTRYANMTKNAFSYLSHCYLRTDI